VVIAIRVVAVLLAVALLPAEAQERKGSLRMTVFELKLHGLAIALETPSGAVYFVDTGKESGDVDSGKHVLAPFLRARGLKEIAGILISHPHRDHFEGASYLLKHFAVKSFVDAGVEDNDYARLLTLAKDRGAAYRKVRAGDSLAWDDGLEVSVLAPPKDGVKSSENDAHNNNSIVLRIRHGRNVFLLPGDIEKEGRDSLLAAVPAETLRADVLVAPHHGFFEGKKFAETVQPKTVIVSCLSEYSDKKPASPGKLATSVFGAVGAKVYVTAWNGTVEVVSDGSTISVKSER
jgi:beta-lactamase superfamily II metal-dependent hydrolase